MRIQTSDFNGPCACGRNHKIEVRDIVIGRDASEALYRSLKEGALSGYRRPRIVCDENTRAAAIGKLGPVWELCWELVLCPDRLHADNHGVELVREKIRETGEEEPDLLIAVGSGTVHDLTRYTAYEKGIPFVSVPTAASVDGFVSTVAAMTWNGMKKTLPAVAPVYVFADTDVFSRAPWRLTASGISDLLGKYTALADWRIAHAVTGEYLCDRVCRMEEDALEEVRRCMDGLKGGDAEAYEKLMYALLLSGLAMQMVGNSRPASCAEHHVSHLWEMEVINGPLDALHGEKVSAGLVMVTKRYKELAQAIRSGRCHARPYEGMETELLRETFGKKGLYEGVLRENTPDPLAAVDPERLEQALPRIAEIIEKLPEAEELEELLRGYGCVYEVGQIGLSEEIVPLTLRLSPYVRNRLSFNRLSRMLQAEE